MNSALSNTISSIDDKTNPDLQGELMATILNFASNRNFDPKGIEVYQRNFMASACRALAISYPTVERLVGEDFFQLLVKNFLTAYPKYHYDWAQWGGEFSEWLAQSLFTDETPYLADCAQLDWQIHLNQTQQVANADFESLALLELQPTEQLRLILNPTVRIIDSNYPIVDIYLAHQQNSDNPDLSVASQKLAEGIGQSAMVVRKEWQSEVSCIDQQERYWIEGCLQSIPLGNLLEDFHKPAMSFEKWLPLMIERQLFNKIDLIDN